jgi:hypothetical protein
VTGELAHLDQSNIIQGGRRTRAWSGVLFPPRALYWKLTPPFSITPAGGKKIDYAKLCVPVSPWFLLADPDPFYPHSATATKAPRTTTTTTRKTQASLSPPPREQRRSRRVTTTRTTTRPPSRGGDPVLVWNKR